MVLIMAEKQEETNIVIQIPRNEIQEGTFFNIPYANWADAVISSLVLCFPIYLIPFVAKVKLIAIGVIACVMFFLCLRGYKNRNLSRVLLTMIKHNKTKCNLHLRSVKDERSEKYYEKEINISNGSKVGQRESYLEKAIRIAKERIQEKLG